MIYFYALVLLALGSFLPWWGYLGLALGAGFFTTSRWRAFSQVGLSAGVVFVIVAYYRDVQANGLISQRLAAMLQLPHWALLYLLLFILTTLSAGLFALTGFQLSLLKGISKRSLL